MRRSTRSSRPRLGAFARFESLEPRALLAVTPFSDAQKTAVLAGLGKLKAFGDQFDTGADLKSTVPGLGTTTIGDVVDVGGRLDTGVASAIKGYFDSDPASATVDELKTYLAALDQFKLGGTSTVATAVDASDTIRVDFSFVASGATPGRTLAIAALDGVGDLGLSFAAQAVSVTGGLTSKLGFTVTKDGTFSFLVSDIDVSVDLSASSLSTVGRLGFLDVALSGGSVTLAAKADSKIDTELSFTTAKLDGDPGVSFATSGTLAATLPITASIGGFATKAGSLPTVTLASTKLFEDLGTVVTTNAAFADVAGFGLYTAGEMLGTIRDVGSLLGRIADRPELATPIPFSSQTIGGLLDLEAAFNAALVSKITKTVDGASVADFTTAADLLAKLPTTGSKAPSVAYDATSHELAYAVTLAHAFDFDASTPVRDAFQTPVTFDLDLRPFTDLATTAKLSISLDAGIQITFGVDLDVETSARISTEPGTPPPENGKLTGTATFQVSLDGGNPVTVVVPAAATTANTKRDDLVTNINQALTTAGLAASVVAEREPASSRITLRQTGLGTRFRVAADPNDPFVKEIGFAPQSLARATVGAGFFDDTTVTAKLAATAASVPITAGRFGFVDISLTPTDDTTTGKITESADFTLALGNPAVSPTDAGRVTLVQANAAVRGTAADFAKMTIPVVAGSAKAEFKGIGLVSDLAGLALTGTPSLTVSLPRFAVGSQSVGTATSSGQFDLGGGKIADDIRFTLTASDGTSASVALTQGASKEAGSLAGNANGSDLVADLNWAIAQAGLGDKVEAFATGMSLQVRGKGTYGTPTASDFTTISYTDFGDLKNFRDMKFSQIVGTLRSAATVLSRYESFGFLASDIPLVGVSVIDLLGYAADYSAKVEQIAANPAGSVKQAEKVINDALGLKPPDAGYIRIQWDAANHSLKIPFVLAKTLTEQRDLLIDIAKMAQASGDVNVQALLAGVDKLFDVSAATKLTATTGYSLGVSLGIDLTDPSSPGTFFYTDQPLLSANVGLRGEAINLQASLGAVGVYVRGGSAVLNKDGNPNTKDAATFGVSLVGNADKKLTFDEIDAATDLSKLVDVSLKAGVGVSLPLYGPSATTKLGDAPLTASIPDLVDFFKKLDPIHFPDFNITPVTIQAPNLAALFDKGIFDLLRDPTILVDGLDTSLSAVQAGLKLTVFNKSYPVVGTALADQANFIDGFREALLGDLRLKLAGVNGIDQFRQVLLDSLGPAGQNILLDATSDGKVTLEDVKVAFTNPYPDLPGDDRATFSLKLGQSTTTGSPVKFDLGLPALGLDMNAGVSLTTGWTYLFGFGLDVREGFFMDTKTRNQANVETPELSVNVNAALTGGATAKLGFLQFDADTIASKLNGFNGTFTIDVKDPGNDGRLSFADISSPAFSTAGLFQTVITANAGVNLTLTGSVGGSSLVPRLLTDFKAEWAYSSLKPTGDPKVAFGNVRLDIGRLATDFVAPIVNQIKQVLEPTRQLLHKNDGFLRQPMPVISQLLGRNVSFLEFGLAASGRDYSEIKPFLDAYDFVMDFTAPSGNIVVPLGAFNLDALGDLSLPSLNLKNVDVGSLNPDTVDPSTWGGPAASATSSMTRSSGFTFVVPMLQSGGWKDAFKLLLGQDVDLFRFDMNVLSLDFNYRQFFPILGPIGATLNGGLSIKAGFTFGFDTMGLREFAASNDVADMFDGFYVKADGTSQIIVNGGISAGVSVDLGFAKGGVEGGVFTSVRMALRDLNNDGKLRRNEMVALIDESPLCLFRVSGEVTARLYAWYEVNLLVTKLKGQKDIVNPITIVSFSVGDDCDPTPVLASQDGGKLYLNIGSRAGDRVKGNISDGAEKFVVEHVSGDGGNETVRVKAFGFTQEYSGVSQILFDAGNGNDSVDCRGVLARVEGSGGEGDDTIFLGDGGGKAWGNAGRDVLTGGKGKDELDGGEGDDTLSGGDGDDTFRDDSGTNTLDGGSGNEVLFVNGTDGSDTLRFWADRVERVGAFTNTIKGIETVRASGGGGADRFEVDTSIAAKGGPVGSLALVSLDLSGDAGADQFLVFGTRSGSTTTLSGGSDDDTFLLSNKGNTLGGKSAGSLDGVYGAVSIDAGGGSGNQLVLDDSGGWGDLGIVVTSGSVTGLAPAAVSFSASGGGAFTTAEKNQGIRILGSATKADIFAIRSTASGNTTRVEGGGGNDQFTIGSDAKSLDGILGMLTIAGDGHDSNPLTTYTVGDLSNAVPAGDTVVFEDSGNSSPTTTYTITKNSVERTGAAKITYETAETIDVHMGSQATTATVQSTADSTTMMLTGNDVANTVTVEATGGSVNLFVDLRGGADTVNLRTAGAGSFTRLFTGAADDRVVLSSVAGTGGDGLGVGGTVDGILGTVEIDAGAGAGNTLVVDDSQAAKANTAAVVTDASITGVAGGTIRYTATGGHFAKTPAANDGILVRNTAFADAVAVRSTRAGSTTRVEGLGGSDTFTVSSDESQASDATSLVPSLDGILGTLTIDGGDHGTGPQTTLSSQDRSNSLVTGDVLLVADQGDGTAAMQYTLTPTTVDRTGMARITYVSTETIRLRTSRMGSTTDVTDTLAGGNTFVVGNAGMDRVDVLSTGTGSNLEVSGAGSGDLVHLRTTGASSFTRILGEGGDDRVVISSTAGTGSLAAPNFSVDGNVSLVRGVVSVDGGAGAGNRLVVDDSTAAENGDVLVTYNRVTGLAAGEIHYAATGGSFTNAGRNDGVLLRGSATGRDVFLVTSTLSGSTTRIDTQGGSDLVSVGSTSVVDRGDLDPLQGLLTLDTGDGDDLVHVNDHGAGYDALRSGGQPKPLNNAATQSGAVTFENTAKFNYRLDPTSLRNSIFTPQAQDAALGLIGGLARTFAGIDYVGSNLERFELVGTDNVNVFTVLPSTTTTFFVDGKLPVSGVPLFGGGDYLNLDTAGTNGRKLGIDTVGTGRWTFTSAHKPVQFTSIERFNHVDIVAVSRENTTPWVDVYDAETGEYKFGLMPYESTFRGGTRLATGDFNNDGIPDLAVVPGKGRPADVRLYDGSPDAAGSYAARPIGSFPAFAAGFATGAFVAVGDTNRDGANDLVIGADGAASVRVYRNTTTPDNAGKSAAFSTFATFDAFERTFRGGARVAVGDMNGDGFAEVVAARGPGGSPEVRVFSGKNGLRTGGQANAFMALASSHRGGVNVAVGDYNGDGVRDVIVGADAGGLPTASVFSGIRVMRGDKLDMRGALWTEQVYPTSFRGGVSVAVKPVAGPVDASVGGDAGFVQTVAIWTVPVSRNTLRYDVLAYEFTTPSGRAKASRPTLSRGVYVDGNRLG